MKDLNISVVIPNYNGVHLFPDTIPALLKALEYTRKKYEIIIIDDCSTDNSVEFLNQTYPQIKLIQNEINQGFSKTINKGIFTAKNELILLLNSDVQLTECYFKDQFKYFELPGTFGVMGKIIGWDNEEVQDGAKYPEMEGFKLKTSLNYLPTQSAGDDLLYSLYLSGANALVNKEKLVLLGGFNELFSPFYIEDVDLSVRAWRCGYKCYFESNSICRHKTSESIRSKENKIYIRTIYNRNKLFFHAIHLKGLYFVGWLIQTLFELIFRILTQRMDYLKSFTELLKNREAIKKSRAEFENLCKHTNVELSLNDVRKSIIRFLKNKKIAFFRN